MILEISLEDMVHIGTGRPGKMGRHFPVREFCQDWKSQGILLKILEKSEKIYWKTEKILEKSGKLPVRNSEKPANMVPYFK